MKTLITDIGKLVIRPIIIDGMFGTMEEGIEIKNEDGETVEINGYTVGEITDKSAVSLFIAYFND